MCVYIYEPCHEKTCLCHMQPTKAQISLYIRAVWSATVFIRFLDSIIPVVSTSKISSLYLASMAAQAGLSLTRSQTLNTGFLVMRPMYNVYDNADIYWHLSTQSLSIATKSSCFKYLSRAMRKCVMSYANNKGTDQPAHPRSLISTFVVHCLDSIISVDSIAEISRP